MLRSADLALYSAKANGRNQTSVERHARTHVASDEAA